MVDKKQNRKYYAREVKRTFSVPYRNGDGERIPRLTDGGAKQYQNGKLIVDQKLCFFRGEVIHPKAKDGYLCSYVTGMDPDLHEEDEIEVLEKLVQSPSTTVMTVEQYDQRYRAKETAEARARVAEAEAEQWKRKAIEMEKELEALTKPAVAAQQPKKDK